ncbi:MAG: peptidylprolyl isomerase [Bacteroides sp.]|nr:peptidylprolyl isomerase [Bacteroides sp.]MCM1379372.1 peptidylprolyl isomerase [Bacteroides sp.]MCM1445232.1 peptidylprolyl isomerase [Prevotella sp.]
MRKTAFLLIAAGVLTLAAKAPKDPVLLEVDNKPVTLSEFEYFYHKNDGNEIEKETPEQYLKRFVDYKLKVAQAREEQRDTTAEFRKEYASFYRELAKPYLQDQPTYDRLLEESYKHTQQHRRIDHLMVPFNKPELMDSLRQALVNGADFEEIVAKYSIDPSKSENHGHYGWVGAGQFPYEFEEIVYDTPLNEWSKVINTQYGLHIVRPTKDRTYLGDIHAAHILVQMNEQTDSAAAKARIDSIYNLLLQGQDFAVMARQNSDCPSAAKDGDLGVFGPGQMVPEFEDVAFSLADGEMSKPFLTRFGWHIVKRYETKPRAKEPLIRQIEEMMKHDIRGVRPRTVRAEQLKKELNFRFDEAGREKMLTMGDELGFDSLMSVMKNDPTPLYYVADSVVTIGDYLSTGIRVHPGNGPVSKQLMDRMNGRVMTALIGYEERGLYNKYKDFRRQADEYAEGLMLVASLEDNVWNQPTKNPEGLKKYFEAHKDNYTFSAPRWKGYVVYATSDSLKNEVADYLATVQPAPEVLGDSLKARFPRDIRIERVVLPKGENQVIDYIAFGGPEPKFSNRYAFFTTYLGHMIDGPEEVADVRNRVTNDYTRELEEKFVEGLRKKFPVKVNNKVLKKAK